MSEKQAKFTPGPWRAGYASETERATEMIVRAEEVDGQPYVAICRSNFGDIDIEANARLIAAAPALLEALKELLAISGYTYMNDNELRYEHEAGNEGIPPIIKARAAIALAQGA